MKVALIEALQEARKWAAEKHRKFLESLTPEQLEIIAKMHEDSEQIEEQKEEHKKFVYPPEGRNFVIWCMTNRLAYEGFTSDEAHLMSVVTVNSEATTPEEREQAAELRKRGPKRENY